MPESFDNMIQCDLCEQWLHMKCEKLNSSPEADEWLCRDCRPPEFNRVKVTVLGFRHRFLTFPGLFSFDS